MQVSVFRLQNVSRCDVVYIQNQRPRRSATEAVLRSDLCFYSTNILYTQISSFAGEFMMSVNIRYHMYHINQPLSRIQISTTSKTYIEKDTYKYLGLSFLLLGKIGCRQRFPAKNIARRLRVHNKRQVLRGRLT